MSESGIKVTDRRMFTPDGELRDDVEAQEERRPEDPTAQSSPADSAPEPASPPQEPRPAQGPVGDEPQPAAFSSAGPESSPSAQSLGPGPPVHFAEIVASLAEPAALFMGDAALPDGQVPEDLDRARHYIDLLDLLAQKTQGRLDAEEQAILEDILYRLKMRYVQKRG